MENIDPAQICICRGAVEKILHLSRRFRLLTVAHMIKLPLRVRDHLGLLKTNKVLDWPTMKQPLN